MKKYCYITLFLLFAYGFADAQAICPPGINENFDGVSNSYVSTGTPGWTVDSNFFTSSHKSIRGKFNAAFPVEVTSPIVSTLGFSNVVLKFKHICKLNAIDGGIIEINTGAGWTQLRTAPSPFANCTYTGSATTFTSSFGWKFNSLSYQLNWMPGNDAALPGSNWWKQEIFDISIAAANQSNVQIRFKAADGDLNGMIGNYGWLIDDIEFCFSTCEMDEPIITPNAPVLSGLIYTPGPFTLCFDITDASTIALADLLASVNGAPFNSIGGLQQINATQWCGTLPVSLNPGDTICWNVVAYDGSCNFNLETYPAIGSTCAIYIIHPPGGSFCDNFDNASTFWNETSSSGSHWQLGIPSCGLTSSPFSFPNSYAVGLSTPYVGNTNCLLTSGTIDFTFASNPKLSFWYGVESEIDHDGARLQYSTDGGISWSTLGIMNDVCGINWYNGAIPSGYAWTGVSNGWTNAKYDLACASGLVGSATVKFRFEFRSDGIVHGCGFKIDNFCITQPPEDDMAIVSIISPRKKAPANFPVPVKVTIENAGNAPQTAFNLVTSIRPNGGTWNVVNTFPWSGSIAPGQRMNVTLPNVSLPAGPCGICVKVILAGDANTANDQACNKVIGNTNPINNDGSFQSSIYWNDYTLSFFSEEPGDAFSEIIADRIINNSANEIFKIYPNPVKDFLYISFDHKFQDPFYFGIKSLSGQEVIARTYSSGELIKVELKSLSPGIYFAHIIADGRSYFTKLLKE